MSLRSLAFLALTASLLAGCASQSTYTAPESSEGRACVSACESSKRLCGTKAQARAESTQAKCERDARDDYERCLATAQGEGGRSLCTHRLCLHEGDSRDCTRDYDECFVGCGGQVETEKCRLFCP